MNRPGIIKEIINRNPNENEFHQAVTEIVASIKPVLDQNPEYRAAKILERIVEPERVILFRVPWVDDRGEVQVNRGFPSATQNEINATDAQNLVNNGRVKERRRGHSLP